MRLHTRKRANTHQHLAVALEFVSQIFYRKCVHVQIKNYKSPLPCQLGLVDVSERFCAEYCTIVQVCAPRHAHAHSQVHMATESKRAYRNGKAAMRKKALVEMRAYQKSKRDTDLRKFLDGALRPIIDEFATLDVETLRRRFYAQRREVTASEFASALREMVRRRAPIGNMHLLRAVELNVKGHPDLPFTTALLAMCESNTRSDAEWFSFIRDYVNIAYENRIHAFCRHPDALYEVVVDANLRDDARAAGDGAAIPDEFECDFD